MILMDFNDFWRFCERRGRYFRVGGRGSVEGVDWVVIVVR